MKKQLTNYKPASAKALAGRQTEPRLRQDYVGQVGEIPQDWEITPMGEMVDLTTGKLNSNAAVENGKYPFFTCSPETLRIDNYVFDSEAILLAGNNAEGKFNIKFYKGKFNVYQRTYVINSNKPYKLDTRFLFYSLENVLEHFQEISLGSATKFLTTKILNNLSIPLPHIVEQNQIASILSSLDSEIELSRKMNQTLEEIGKALFKHWFVDFEFPWDFKKNEFSWDGKPYKSSGGKTMKSELGKIPEGWKKGELSDLVEINNETINPQKHKDAIFIHYSIPAYDEKMFPVLEKGKEIKSNKTVIQDNSVLLSKLNPKRFRRIWAIEEDKNVDFTRISSTEFINFKPIKLGNWAYVYFLFNNDVFYNRISRTAQGSTGSRQRLNPNETLKEPINIPNDELIKEFNLLFNNLLKKKVQNVTSSNTLSKIRDSLLPRLMSGRLRVK